MNTPHTHATQLLQTWSQAEQDNNAAALARVLADEFVGIGPFGFVLDRERWLGRFSQGLTNHTFAISDVEIRDLGSVAVAVGVLTQNTTYQGRDNSGRFRISVVTIPTTDGWRIASAHIGPLQLPPTTHQENQK